MITQIEDMPLQISITRSDTLFRDGNFLTFATVCA
jgi:hypothetical protein